MTSTAVPTTTPARAEAPPSGVQFGATRRGLRVAWLPAPGPVRARLAFRVGAADERLPERGLTHLVAHLAHRLTDGGSPGGAPSPLEPAPPCSWPLEVAFTATGTDAEVRDRLVALCEGLASLGEVLPEEVAHEVGHLDREADLGVPGPWDLLRTARHGLAGWGHLHTSELALPAAGAAALTSWVERWFTAGNAVLSVTGPQPPGWVLPLLSGGARPAAPQPSALEQTPARVTGPSGLVAVSALARDGTASRAGWWWLHRLVQEELRVRGLSGTDVEVELSATGDGRLELCLAVHTAADRGQDALHAVQEATARACSEALPEADLARWGGDLDVPGAVEELDDLARAWLLSGSAEPPAAAPRALLLQEAAALRPADVLAALREAMGTGLLQAPHDVAPPAELAPAAAPALAAPTGATWVAADGGPARLVLGADGVQVQHGDGSSSTARWERAVAVLHRPGGGRAVLDATGQSVEVDPGAWADGTAAVEVLDAHAPEHLVVPLAAIVQPAAPGGGRAARALAALRALASVQVGRPRTARGD